MLKKEETNLQIQLVTAISTAILAFTAAIGLILALMEYLETKKAFFSFTMVIVLLITLTFILMLVVIKRWITK